MIQTNIIAFLILWKAKEYETSKKYISQAKTYIYQMIKTVSDQLEMDMDHFFQNSQMDSPTKNSLLTSLVEDVYEHNSQKIIDFFMQSDSENPVEVAL